MRLLEGLTALALVNALLLSFGPQLWISVLLAPPLGIVLTLLAAGGLVVLDALILRWARGRSSILASLLTAAVGAVLTVGLFVAVGPEDGWWTLSPIPPVAGVVSALVAGLFLPRWWLRAVGGTALVVAVAMLAVPNAIASAQHRAEVDAAAEAAAAAALEQRVTTSTLPFITELPGSSVWDVQAGDYISRVRVVTADGGGLWLDTVGESPDTGRAALGCWLLVGDLGIFDETVTMEHYAGVCERVGADRWQTTDGTGLAVAREGVLVLASAMTQDVAEGSGASRPASASELSDAAEHLRLITRDELRSYLLNPPH